MQKLKEDIKQRILTVAHQEFIKHGVRQTSIRTIANKAGIAVGNMYHYFKSKDELFCEVMQPIINAIDKYIFSHNKEERLSIDVFSLKENQEESILAMLTLIKEFHEDLKVLFFKAEGTSLAGYKNKLIDYQIKIGNEYLRLMKERYPHLNTNISPFFMRLTCSTWMTMFSELVKQEQYDENEIKLAIEQYVAYGMAGWKELMKP